VSNSTLPVAAGGSESEPYSPRVVRPENASYQRSTSKLRDIATRSVRFVEREKRLDAPSYKVEHGVAFAFNLIGQRGRAVQDCLQGVWLGHPLHPVMTNLPLGAWSAAVAFDATDILTPKSRQFAPAAELWVGLGVLGGIGAGLTGLADWQHTHDDARRLGLVHGVLNTAALTLFSASWLDRSRGRNSRARVLSAIGYALTVTASYLGGDLVFRHRVGVDHSDGRLTPRSFVAVLAESALAEDSPTSVECSVPRRVRVSVARIEIQPPDRRRRGGAGDLSAPMF
jgi:uncharacterized membrane protein